MEDDEPIARNIRRLRELHGMSQADLADALKDRGVPGMHPQTITKIEAGTRAVKLTEGLVLAEVLQVRPEELRRLHEERALIRWRMARNTQATKVALSDAVDALAIFLVGSARLLDDYKQHGAEVDVEVAAMARTLGEVTAEDVVQQARAKSEDMEALAAAEEAGTLGPGAVSTKLFYENVTKERARRGEHCETP